MVAIQDSLRHPVSTGTDLEAGRFEGGVEHMSHSFGEFCRELRCAAIVIWDSITKKLLHCYLNFMTSRRRLIILFFPDESACK
jgi:hypothetical protein